MAILHQSGGYQTYQLSPSSPCGLCRALGFLKREALKKTGGGPGRT